MMVIKHSLVGSPYLVKPVKVPFFGGLGEHRLRHEVLGGIEFPQQAGDVIDVVRPLLRIGGVGVLEVNVNSDYPLP